MKNRIELEAIVLDDVPSVYYHDGQVRVEATVQHVNPVTEGVHRFRLQLRGDVAQRFFLDSKPGARVDLIGRLKAGSQGRVKILVTSCQFDLFDAPVDAGDATDDAELVEKKRKLWALAEEKNKIYQERFNAVSNEPADVPDASDDDDNTDME